VNLIKVQMAKKAPKLNEMKRFIFRPSLQKKKQKKEKKKREEGKEGRGKSAGKGGEKDMSRGR